MGTKIKAKYDGKCKICGSVWNVGEDIYYQKEPKALCIDDECFETQGGKVEYRPKPQSSYGYNKTPIITKLPDCEISDDIKRVTEIWDQFFVVAHHRAKALYPNEDVNNDRFGQIRSKMMDQFMMIAKLTKEE